MTAPGRWRRPTAPVTGAARSVASQPRGEALLCRPERPPLGVVVADLQRPTARRSRSSCSLPPPARGPPRRSASPSAVARAVRRRRSVGSESAARVYGPSNVCLTISSDSPVANVQSRTSTGACQRTRPLTTGRVTASPSGSVVALTGLEPREARGSSGRTRSARTARHRRRRSRAPRRPSRRGSRARTRRPRRDRPASSMRPARRSASAWPSRSGWAGKGLRG